MKKRRGDSWTQEPGPRLPTSPQKSKGRLEQPLGMAPKLPRVKPAASLTSSPGPVKLPKLPTLPTSPMADAQRKPTWGMWAQLVAVVGLGEPFVMFVLGGCRLLLLGYGLACLMGHAWRYGAAFITHCAIGVLGLLLGVRLQVAVAP
jgi:hypothetical protein